MSEGARDDSAQRSSNIPRRSQSDRADRFQKRATSLLLVLMTLFIGALCIIFLSATLTQGRLASITIDGVSLSIPRLSYVAKRWSELQETMSP